MRKIKKGDQVIIIAGKDKGKQGVVLSIESERVVVEGINVAKRHTKPNPQLNQQGGILEKPMPIHRSNVMLYDPTANARSRVGIKKVDGESMRYYKNSGEVIVEEAKG